VMTHRGGSQGRGGRAAAFKAEEDGPVTPHQGGSQGGGGRAAAVGVESSRATGVGHRWATTGVESSRVAAVRHRRVAIGGQARWDGGSNNKSGRVSDFG
jgi:hypothetical protein